MTEYRNGEPVYNEEYGWGNVRRTFEETVLVYFDTVADVVNVKYEEVEPDRVQRVLRAFENVGAATAEDVTSKEYSNIPLPSGKQKVEVEFSDSVIAARYFNEYADDGYEVFRKPDGRFAEGEHDRKIIIAP